MEHQEVKGNGPDGNRRWYCDFQEDWSGLNPFHGFNWRNFTLIMVRGEYAKYSGRCEVELGLLGFTVRLTYIYDHSFNNQLNDARSTIESELRARTGAIEVVDATGGEFERMCRELDDKKE